MLGLERRTPENMFPALQVGARALFSMWAIMFVLVKSFNFRTPPRIVESFLDEPIFVHRLVVGNFPFLSNYQSPLESKFSNFIRFYR